MSNMLYQLSYSLIYIKYSLLFYVFICYFYIVSFILKGYFAYWF